MEIEKKKLEIPSRYHVKIDTINGNRYMYDCDDCYWCGNPTYYLIQVNEYKRLMFPASSIEVISKIDIEARAKSERGEL